MAPLVTVCIPNYNKADFIGDTIDSIYSQIYRNIELIIIDDCSTDNSVEVIQNKIINPPFKTTFLQNSENRGICYSLNKAIEISNGKYYQMIGSDDLILNNKINNQVNILEQLSDDYALTFGKPYRIDIHGKSLQKDYYESIDFDISNLKNACFEDLLLKNFIPSTSHLVRMDAIKKVGMYDESLYAEDWDLWLRIIKQFKFFFTNEYDSAYRIVPSSLSNNSNNFANVYDSYCQTLLKHLNYSKKGNKYIAQNICSMAIIVYKYNGNSAKKLLEKNFQLNRSFKSLVLFIACKLGIKYSYYNSLKFKK
ncbi:MAG: glycosyltransferase [Bacteroidota bacterium]|nr:glycosyltransferase [Bacteroidota bacterium]